MKNYTDNDYEEIKYKNESKLFSRLQIKFCLLYCKKIAHTHSYPFHIKTTLLILLNKSLITEFGKYRQVEGQPALSIKSQIIHSLCLTNSASFSKKNITPVKTSFAKL